MRKGTKRPPKSPKPPKPLCAATVTAVSTSNIAITMGFGIRDLGFVVVCEWRALVPNPTKSRIPNPKSLLRRDRTLQGYQATVIVRTPFAKTVANDCSARGAGPWTTAPLVLYREPWHGQTHWEL